MTVLLQTCLLIMKRSCCLFLTVIDAQRDRNGGRGGGSTFHLPLTTDCTHTHTESVHNVHRVLLSMLMCRIASSVSWLHKASLYKRAAGNYTTVSLLQAFPFPFLSAMDLWRFKLYPRSKEGTQVKILRSVYRSRHIMICCFSSNSDQHSLHWLLAQSYMQINYHRI